MAQKLGLDSQSCTLKAKVATILSRCSEIQNLKRFNAVLNVRLFITLYFFI